MLFRFNILLVFVLWFAAVSFAELHEVDSLYVEVTEPSQNSISIDTIIQSIPDSTHLEFLSNSNHSLSFDPLMSYLLFGVAGEYQYNVSSIYGAVSASFAYGSLFLNHRDSTTLIMGGGYRFFGGSSEGWYVQYRAKYIQYQKLFLNDGFDHIGAPGSYTAHWETLIHHDIHIGHHWLVDSQYTVDIAFSPFSLGRFIANEHSNSARENSVQLSHVVMFLAGYQF